MAWILTAPYSLTHSWTLYILKTHPHLPHLLHGYLLGNGICFMFVNDSSWALLPKALRLKVCHDFAPQRTSQKLDRHRQTASPQHPAKSVLCCFLPSEVRLSIPTREDPAGGTALPYLRAHLLPCWLRGSAIVRDQFPWNCHEALSSLFQMTGS